MDNFVFTSASMAGDSLNNKSPFKDKRIEKLSKKLLDELIKKETVCLRTLAEDRKTEVAFGRLLRNDKFKVETIVSRQIEKTNLLAQDSSHVLLIQDSVFLSHGQKNQTNKTGLGTGGNEYALGFYMHPTIAVDADENVLYGLSSFYQWVRNELAERERNLKGTRSALPIEEKESYRWILSANSSKPVFNPNTVKTIIADREADIYDEFCTVPDENTHLLVRSAHNRVLSNGQKLKEYIDQLEKIGKFKIDLPAIKGKRKARKASFDVKIANIEIKRPPKSGKSLPKTISINCIDICEITNEKQKIHWRLLTTHDVKTTLDAEKIVNWYKQRWHIEQLFRTMKNQGFKVEDCKVVTYDSLKKMTTLALIAAVDILKLTIAREGKNKRKMLDVFDEDDEEILEDINQRLQGATAKQKNRHRKFSLAWSAWIIARLGGWKGYSSERPPGPITMYNGFKRFWSSKREWELRWERN